MKILLSAIGVLCVVLGLHWIGQGTGYFIWPSNPVMDNQIQWAYYGAIAVLVGVALLAVSRRKNGR
jgi:membrane protein DedA with SNARE-associated domain